MNTAASLDSSPDTHRSRSDGHTPSAAPGAALHVRLLDGLQLSVGGEPVRDLPHGKARALLVLLLLHRRRPQTRARLCAQLWPEAEAAGARNSLNVTLHRLRRALGDPSLVRHGESGYQLVCNGAVWLDAEQFLWHAEQGRLAEAAADAATPAADVAHDAQARAIDQAIAHFEAAAALYQSDLLDDGEPDAALALDAQRLHDELNQVLDRLARLRERTGDWHGSLRTTLRQLALDDCNELAHRRLMRAYARIGQPQLAERQYRSCVAALRNRLSASPAPSTTECYRQVLSASAVD